MLSFFRGKHGSKFVGVFLGLVLLAMVATGVGTQGSLGSITSLLSGGGDSVAKIGGQPLSMGDVSQRAQGILEQQRQQNPELTMQGFVAQGAIDKITDQLIGQRAVERFAEEHGMKVSNRAVDAEIAQMGVFAGVDGKFDHNKFLSLISQKHLSEAQVREDLARDLMTQQMLVPIAGAASMPKGIATAYAALLTEVREGRVAIIPAAAMANTPKPTEVQINAFYAAHHGQYTMPERRVIEYVVYPKSKFADAAKPSDADIAAAYAKDKDKYAAKDLRTLTQVIVPDEAKAKSLLEKARGGASLKDAAKSIGLEAITLANQDKLAYAGLTSTAVADAAFTAERGQVATLAKSPLGWHVVHVDSATHDPGKTLDQARGGIITTLSAGKIEELFANFQNKLSDKASAGATLAELAKANGGDIVTTPAIIVSGASPDQPTYKPDPDMGAILKDGFKADTKVSSEPLIVPFGKTRDQIAVYHVKTITPAGPIPLVKIHDVVAQATLLDAQAKAARIIAGDVAAKANKGTALADAVSATGLKLPPVDTMKASKIQLMQAQKQVPPPVREMFNIPLHHAKVVEAADHQGWFVIWLEAKTPVDVSQNQAFIAQVQQQLGTSYGQELTSEFGAAAQVEVGVTKYPANIKALAASLTGNQGQ